MVPRNINNTSIDLRQSPPLNFLPNPTSTKKMICRQSTVNAIVGLKYKSNIQLKGSNRQMNNTIIPGMSPITLEFNTRYLVFQPRYFITLCLFDGHRSLLEHLALLLRTCCMLPGIYFVRLGVIFNGPFTTSYYAAVSLALFLSMHGDRYDVYSSSGYGARAFLRWS